MGSVYGIAKEIAGYSYRERSGGDSGQSMTIVLPQRIEEFALGPKKLFAESDNFDRIAPS